ncbi:MAG: PorT family protein [Prevotella sp.]|nr:PorT family protein [Prevotella sp.]
MKRIVIIAVTLIASLNMNAQIEAGNWYFTPKAGVSVSDMTGQLLDPSKVEGNYDVTLRSMVSFTAGIDFEYAMLDQLGFAFGLNYTKRGSKTKENLFKLTMDYINMPLTLNFYPIPEAGLAIKAGVQVGFSARKRVTVDGVEYNADYNIQQRFNNWGRPTQTYVESELSKQFNKVDLSIPIAISYEFKNIMLEARYNLGLINVMKEDPENSKHRFWQFTLGYKFDLGD